MFFYTCLFGKLCLWFKTFLFTFFYFDFDWGLIFFVFNFDYINFIFNFSYSIVVFSDGDWPNAFESSYLSFTQFVRNWKTFEDSSLQNQQVYEMWSNVVCIMWLCMYVIVFCGYKRNVVFSRMQPTILKESNWY